MSEQMSIRLMRSDRFHWNCVSNKSSQFAPPPVHYTDLFTTASVVIFNHVNCMSVKRKLTFITQYSDGFERKMEKLTLRVVAQCQGHWRVVRATQKNPLLRQRKRCNIFHSQMNSGFFFPTGQVCTLWELELSMAILMTFCLMKTKVQ